MNYELIRGNNIDILKTIEDNTFDSIVTDPPYELGFMGKSWDSTGIAFNKELWAECLRVLKPGGHLISFSGSRTYHRMAVAIEDAGFEIRDQIMWVYGSGFPKSLDVSKSIDKLDAKEEKQNRNYKFTEWFVNSCNLTNQQIDKILETNTMGRHFTDVLPNGKQPFISTREQFEKLRPYFNCEVPEWIEKLVNERTVESENFKNREVIGNKKSGIANKEEKDRYTIGASNAVEVDITAPSTPQAKQWQGWGTALKPAHEPMVLARKPLSEKTVAENVLKWGTGAINIDSCRVPTEDNLNGGSYSKGNYSTDDTVYKLGLKRLEDGYTQPTGRWPANFIHDGLNEEWSRYFYCPKASKKDRNDGLDGFPVKGKVFNGQNSQAIIDGYKDGSVEDKFTTSPSANNHPTVKPTDLMAYLCRLITPPGGTVLDPFNGSGSTGKACAREGFDYLGLDLSQEYLDISKARIEHEISKNK